MVRILGIRDEGAALLDAVRRRECQSWQIRIGQEDRCGRRRERCHAGAKDRLERGVAVIAGRCGGDRSRQMGTWIAGRTVDGHGADSCGLHWTSERASYTARIRAESR